MTVMAENKLWRHPVTNRVKASENDRYMEINGFTPYDGEFERDKRTGTLSAKMTRDELVDEARERGLSVSGTKTELLERIAQDQADQTSSASAGDTEGTDSPQGSKE